MLLIPKLDSKKKFFSKKGLNNTYLDSNFLKVMTKFDIHAS